MKIITKPTVQIVAATQFFGSPDFEIPDDGTDAVKTSAFAAKVCYDAAGKNGRDNEENQKAILEHRHGSVLEHSYVSLYITGITRAVSLEINRHRTFNISQRSTRYVKEEDSAIVLEPYYAHLYQKWNPVNNNEALHSSRYNWRIPSLDYLNDEALTILNFLTASENAIHSYQAAVDSLMMLNPEKLSGFDLRKWARGKARNILPHALETRVVYTANVRAWRWFIESRSGRHAEPEIRRLADTVLHVMQEHSPVHFQDFRAFAIVDGIVEWVPTFSKV